MSSSLFEQLLQDFEKLTDLSDNTGLPQLNRDLGQIANESYLLSSRLGAKQELNANTHHFLAQGGSNTHEIAHGLKNMETKVIFESSEMIKDTNVEAHLKKVHEDYMKEAIAETRQNAKDNLLSSLNEQMHRNWAEKKLEILEDWEQQEENKCVDRVNQKQKSNYAAIIREFNQCRVRYEKVPIFAQLGRISKSAECTKTQHKCLQNAWDVAAFIANESEAYSVSHSSRSLIQRAKGWLEKEYLTLVNRQLTLGAFEGIGGSPSVVYRMNAYAKSLASKLADKVYLEMDQGTPVWLLVYLLFRIGKPELAYDYVDSRQTAFYDSPGFQSYLEEYVTSEDHRLSEPTRQKIDEQFRSMQYSNSLVDPYKKLIYKILGRCQLSHKNELEVDFAIEDFIWLQYMLIREDPHQVESSSSVESYRLVDLQRMMVNYGPDYFDSDNLNPWLYFYLLILTLQFERAIDFMYKRPSFRLEAVHFSIALAYYNLIRIPKDAYQSSLLHATEETVSFDFSRLIRHYVDLLDPDHKDTDNAIAYYCLITLYQTPAMKKMCYQYLIQYIASLDNYKQVICDLEPLRPLFGISQEDREEFDDQVLGRVAYLFELMNRYQDAVSIYQSMGKPEKALSLLIHRLDHAVDLAMAVVLDQGNSASLDQALVDFCTASVHAFWGQEDTEEYRLCHSLISILKACIAYQQIRLEDALIYIKQLHVIPFEGQDVAAIINMVDTYQHSLDKSLKKHVPGMVLMTVEILVSLYQTAYQQSMYATTAEQKMALVQKYESYKAGAQSVSSFVGLANLDMRPELYQKLNRTMTGLHWNQFNTHTPTPN